MAGDGNCLFRSVSVGLFGHENQHKELRSKAMKFLKENIGDYPYQFESEKEGFAYIARMSQCGQWGG